jgi:hypothetical protein
MKYSLFAFAVVSFALAGCSSDKGAPEATTTGAATTTAGATATAYSPIQDAFNANCVQCHGGANPKAGLNLTDYDHAMKGGKDGPVIKAGDSAGSLITQVLKPDHVPHMPPKGQIPEATQKALAAWIDAGAKNG